MLERTEVAITRLCNVLVVVVGLAIVFMMIAVTADVSFKFVLNAPIYGTSEVVGNYFMISIVFLSIPIVELNNKAIYVDLFYNMMPRPARMASLYFVYLLQIAFFSVLTYQSFGDAIEAMEKSEIVEGVVNLVIWPSRFLLLIGFCLAGIISILRLIQVATLHPAIAPLLNPPAHHVIEEEI